MEVLRSRKQRSEGKEAGLKTCLWAHQQHALAKKVLVRFSEADGPLVLVALESLDLDGDDLYEYATYNGGDRDARCHARWPAERLSDRRPDSLSGGFSRASMILFVLCDNWIDTRTDYLGNWRPRESRVVFYEEDVYHVLTRKDDNYDSIRNRDSRVNTPLGRGRMFVVRWNRGRYLVRSVLGCDCRKYRTHLLAALDGEGYLIWSPK